MPLYEYECTKCGKRTEKIENVSGPHLKKCPHCAGKVESVLTAPAIQFKGSGWYVTDYAAKSGGGDGDAKKADAAAGDSKDKKEAASRESTAKETTAKEGTAKDSKDKKATKKK